MKRKKAFCPLCESDGSNSPSLSVTETDDGQTLVYCFSDKNDCNRSHAALLRAFQETPQPTNAEKRWRRRQSAPPEALGAKIIAEYDYGGGIRKVKYEWPDGWRKDYRWKPRKPGPILYRPPTIEERGRRVFVVEGEKDVDSLRDRGFVATSAAEGNWSPELAQQLYGCHVVLLRDYDAAGRRKRDTARAALSGVAASVVEPELPYEELDSGGQDVSDFLDENGPYGAQELRRLVELAGAPSTPSASIQEPVVTPRTEAHGDDDVERVTAVLEPGRASANRIVVRLVVNGQDRRYLVKPRQLSSRERAERELKVQFDDMDMGGGYELNTYAVLMELLQERGLLAPTGMTARELFHAKFPEPRVAVPDLITEGLTVIAGSPKIGKSWMLYELALACSEGSAFLNRKVDQPRDVLYLSLEDSLRRMQSRLAALRNGEPPEHLKIETEWPPFTEGGLDMILSWSRRHRSRYQVIIVDTLQRMRHGENRDKGRNAYEQDVETLADFQEFAQSEPGLAVITSHHLKKGDETDFVAMLSGSLGIPGTADTVIVLKRKRNSDSGTLELTGRDLPELERSVSFDGTRWLDQGDLAVNEETSTRDKVAKTLRKYGQMTKAEISDASGIPQAALKILYRMESDGEVRRSSGRPVTWMLVAAEKLPEI